MLGVSAPYLSPSAVILTLSFAHIAEHHIYVLGYSGNLQVCKSSMSNLTTELPCLFVTKLLGTKELAPLVWHLARCVMFVAIGDSLSLETLKILTNNKPSNLIFRTKMETNVIYGASECCSSTCQQCHGSKFACHFFLQTTKCSWLDYFMHLTNLPSLIL